MGGWSSLPDKAWGRIFLFPILWDSFPMPPSILSPEDTLILSIHL
uniref:Large S protein n=1 Tax=Hepatitis B virus TaxID=10407 RepID=D2X4N9_HBV|nr:large S protein [Hepatitis B virus]